MRLIDANALRELMFSYYGCVNEQSSKEYYRGETLMNYEVADMIEDCIDNAPTVDAVEVVHGRWIKQPVNCSWWAVCSECEKTPTNTRDMTPYCPNCGAKMDGERKGENGN